MQPEIILRILNMYLQTSTREESGLIEFANVLRKVGILMFKGTNPCRLRILAYYCKIHSTGAFLDLMKNLQIF